MRTTYAFLVSLVILLFGFIWTTYNPTAPYGEMVMGIGGLFGANSFKRYKDNALHKDDIPLTPDRGD